MAMHFKRKMRDDAERRSAGLGPQWSLTLLWVDSGSFVRSTGMSLLLKIL